MFGGEETFLKQLYIILCYFIYRESGKGYYLKYPFLILYYYLYYVIIQNSAVSHTSNHNKSSIEATWTAPASGQLGDIEFRYHF